MSESVQIEKGKIDMFGRRDDLRALVGKTEMSFTDRHGDVFKTTGNVYRVAYFKKKDITRIYFNTQK